jgi:hypothetical protein
MSGILNLLLAGAASIVKDAYFNLVTLLLNTTATNGAQNNTFLDSSTNNFSITRNGNVTQGTFTPFSQTGWSNYFNGSSSLSSTSSGLAVGTSTFTLEMWVYFPAATGNTDLYDTRSSNSADSAGFVFGVGSDNCLKYYAGSGSNVSFGTVIPTNQWVHIALTRNGSNTINAFLNGVLSGTSATDSVNKTNSRFSLFATVGNAAYTTGYCSNARLVVGSVLYTSTFTPPTAPLTAITNTVLLTSQSNNFVNNSSTSVSLTIGGTPSVQAFSPFAPTIAYSTDVVGGSGYFDASGDYLSFATNNSAFQLGSGDWSVEGWVYLISSSVSYIASGQTDATTIGGSSFYVGYNGDTCSAFSGGGRIDLSLGTVNKYEWTHIVFCRSGSTVSCFKNGVRQATGTFSGTINNGATNYPPKINATGPSTGSEQYLSNVRILKGTSAYNAASTTITIPTAPLTAITNTSLLLNYTNAGIYDSAAKNDLETVSNAQVSTTTAKWGTTSMKFNGTTDYLIGRTSPLFNVFNSTSSSITVEGWVYLNSYTTDQTLFSYYVDSNNWWEIQLAGGQANTPIRINVQTGGSLTSLVANNPGLSATTWTHIAAVKSGANWYLFLNGTNINSNASAPSNNNISGVPYVGYRGNANFLNGYIDDLRITVGYARYTANFTAPTAAFPIQ